MKATLCMTLSNLHYCALLWGIRGNVCAKRYSKEHNELSLMIKQLSYITLHVRCITQ